MHSDAHAITHQYHQANIFQTHGHDSDEMMLTSSETHTYIRFFKDILKPLLIWIP